MIRSGILLLVLVLICQYTGVSGQEPPNPNPEQKKEKPEGYIFTDIVSIECSDIKKQGNTGTCWCFSSTSFIESELIRQGKGQHDLSELFIVKNMYMEKARNYLRRQGKTNFGEGALAHDYLRTASRYGLVPESAYSGLKSGKDHDHGELFKVLEGTLKALATQKKLSTNWPVAIEGITDAYLGESPLNFSYQEKDFTPKKFADSLGFDAKDYVGFTSFTHHDFDEQVVLELPDNFSSGIYHNVEIDKLVAMVDKALENNFTLVWDGDVSERGFSQSNGVAVAPAKGQKDYLKTPGKELRVSQAMRQDTYEELSTTDDHLMHVVGVAHDQNGTKYYRIKNSWGPTGKFKGFLYMSESYFRLKTVAVTFHKDVLEIADPESDTKK